MAEEKLELFKKGCLGTCWYGKYHYLEPWAGCSHNCPYCYARFRKSVNEKLRELGASFSRPALLLPEAELLAEIEKKVFPGEIEILKLSRFTDIFVPEFINSGLTLKILELLVKSPVKRIIITTKGVPDEKIISLISQNPEKISYNAAVRPGNALDFRENAAPAAERIKAAAKIASAGVLTTLHLDPFMAGFDDGPELSGLLEFAKKEGLKRVMFSYLLVSEEILEALKGVLPAGIFGEMKDRYDLELSKEYLPGQTDTFYYALKKEAKKVSVEKTALLLNDMEFEFVLCSLKNTPGLETSKFRGVKLCDGKFYA